MKIKIKPSTLNGKIEIPPSKSYSHRAVIAAALAESEKKSMIDNLKFSVDITTTTLPSFPTISRALSNLLIFAPQFSIISVVVVISTENFKLSIIDFFSLSANAAAITALCE